jgi:Asp-tRNA(Asn)/Glu-tRNA(Gln) amidotransferase A subunit family amidase
VQVLERLRLAVDAAAARAQHRQSGIGRPPVAAVDYLEAVGSLGALTRRICARGDGEVLLTPTLTRLPVEIGAVAPRAGVSDDAALSSALVRPWNMTGRPAISLPLLETHDRCPSASSSSPHRVPNDLLLALAAELDDAAARPRHRARGGSEPPRTRRLPSSICATCSP